VDIYQMIKKNFCITDLMKLGDHPTVEDFIKSATLPDQEFTFTSDYYRLHTFKIENFEKKFAIIDHRGRHRDIWENEEYWKEFNYRTEKLHNLGFVFIIGHPWESLENVSSWLDLHNLSSWLDYNKLLSGKNYIHWSGDCSWFWFLMHRKHKNKKYNFDHTQKKYDFLYLNKQSRTHRKKLFDALRKESLLDHSLISFLDAPYKIKLNSSYELPWVDAENYPRYGSDQDIHEPQFNDSAFNLVSETNDNNHDVFITEKLWKPIIAQQIFVVHGNFGYLKKLREMGFRTFNSVFDESYDTEQDPDRRIEKIVSLCRHLRTVDKSKIYRETESIRQYNYDKFFDKTSLSSAVNETVLGFLKFADRS
jgi:hypothetical protein